MFFKINHGLALDFFLFYCIIKSKRPDWWPDIDAGVWKIMLSATGNKRDSARMRVRRYVMDLIYQCAGESVRLPSNRELAQELGIARSTTQLELKLLLKEGFLVSRRGIGTFTVPTARREKYQAPLIGILDGDGKIIYEPYYRLTLGAHVAMEAAKMPAVIQQIHLFSECENDLVEELRSICCDVLVCIAPFEKQLPLLRKIQQYRPVITVDVAFPGLTGIELDRYRKGRVLGEALLAEGRRKVLFIQTRRYHDTTFRGCRDIFAESGIHIPDNHFFLNDLEGFEQLLETGFRPQAIAPALEYFAPIINLMRKYGIDLQEECRIATFMFKPDNAPGPVMLFTFPFEEFGKQVVTQIRKRLADPSLPPEHIMFDYDYKMSIV